MILIFRSLPCVYQVWPKKTEVSISLWKLSKSTNTMVSALKYYKRNYQSIVDIKMANKQLIDQ